MMDYDFFKRTLALAEKSEKMYDLSYQTYSTYSLAEINDEMESVLDQLDIKKIECGFSLDEQIDFTSEKIDDEMLQLIQDVVALSELLRELSLQN